MLDPRRVVIFKSSTVLREKIDREEEPLITTRRK